MLLHSGYRKVINTFVDTMGWSEL